MGDAPRMAQRSTKFGTFGGVFTPSLLTILGVIMYLRLPYIVGQAGLWTALGIMAAAHVISVTTGLSISSIATDKKVGAGGAYYIVSRSLGLPIGGTLGLALFVGLSFSISLYLIGFSESFLAKLGIEATKQNIQICGTATIIGLTIVTLISTSFAIKTQYVILAAIAASLLSIGLSPGPGPAAGIHLQPIDNGQSVAELFGLFFPAVTGFTAGVNMSGDLKDPKQSIPIGTMAAIGTGMLVYVSLGVFVAWKIPVDELLTNTNILADKARWGALVIAGIWGATLSSALGSILGAPRILQTLSADRVTPVWFAKGHGKDNEPRRALLIAFAIGEAGILIGELDVIARLVSIFFIATYGFLNLSCAIESWASTDFRPDFRIPRLVPVIGAVVCLLMMIQLDPAATAATTVLFGIVFVWLKRRELALESGDTWEGVWSSLVRWGLEKLDAGGSVQRNWRPNVLSFSWRELRDHGPLLAFGASLIRDRGVLTDFRLRTRDDVRKAKRQEESAGAGASAGESESEAEPEQDDALIAGHFERELETEDPWTSARAIARFHGFAGLEPNTVLINWAEHRHDRPGFCALLDELVSLDFNLLLLARDPQKGFGNHARIDLWWTPTQGSFELELALVRFLSLSDDWQRAQLRFLLLNDDPSRGDALFKSAQRALVDGRVQASVKVLNNAIGSRPLYDWVRQESGDADLVVVGLPAGPLAAAPARIAALDELCNDIGSVLVLRGSSHFAPLLARVGAPTPGSKSDGRADQSSSTLSRTRLEEFDAIELVPLAAPEPVELRVAARELSLAHDELAREFHAECLSLIYGHDAALIEQLTSVISRAFDQLDTAIGESVLLRQRKQLNKVQTSFLFQARRALSEFEADRLSAQVDALERRVEVWLEQLDELMREAPKQLQVTRDPAILAAHPEDPPSLRRAKRRLRVRHALQGSQLSYAIPVTPLYAHALRWQSPKLLEQTLHDMAQDDYQVLLELGRSISEARHALDEFARRLTELPAAKPKPQAQAQPTPKPEPTPTFTAPGSTEVDIDLDAPDESDEPELDPRERAKQELTARIAERRALVVERLDKLLARTLKRNEQRRDLLLHGSRTLAQQFANELDRLDVHALIRRERKLPKQAEGLGASLVERAGTWRKNRQLVLNRAALELHTAGFQQRLRTLVERTKDSATQAIQAGIYQGVARLRGALAEYKAELARGEDAALTKLKFTHELRGEFDDKRVIEELAREAQAASAELPEGLEVIGDDALISLEDQPFDDSEVLTVSLRRLVDFLVQAEFLANLGDHAARVSLAEQRAVGVAQDVLHLVSFNLSEYEHEHEAQAGVALIERLGPVIDSGLARLDVELEQLRRLAPTLTERIDAQLGKILDRTEAYAITGSEDSLKLYVRHEQAGARARVAGVRRAAQRVSKRLIVGLWYGRSAGLLRARADESDTAASEIEGVLALVNASSPRPAIVDALPFFYAQPFLGQGRVSVEFWVGRARELAEIAAAVANWRQGRSGALVIVGERLSGKTSLTRYAAREQFERRNKYNILPPRSGSAELGLFKARLEKELRLAGDDGRDWDDIFAAIPTGSVIMIHDLELWWNRSVEGARVIEQLVQLMERWGDRVMFMLELDIHAFRAISRVVPLADHALAVVECRPLDAEHLEELIDVRHRSTGLQIVLDERDEDELPAWTRARLFTRFFDISGGHVGVALQSWIAAIEQVEGERLVMRTPSLPEREALAELRIEHVATLLQLVLHKRLTRARLARISGLDERVVGQTFDVLARMGLVVEDNQGVVEINRYVHHHVVESLRERGYL